MHRISAELVLHAMAPMRGAMAVLRIVMTVHVWQRSYRPPARPPVPCARPSCPTHPPLTPPHSAHIFFKLRESPLVVQQHVQHAEHRRVSHVGPPSKKGWSRRVVDREERASSIMSYTSASVNRPMPCRWAGHVCTQAGGDW